MPETIASAHSSARPASPTGPPGARHRWAWWGLGAVALVAALAMAGLHFLDPWLRRTLEKQVAEKTHGQYRLQVGELHTSLWGRAVRLSRVRLRPAPVVADTLPRIRVDVARLHLTGIGLLALLRKSVVPLDSVVLDSARIEVLALARQPSKAAGQPLHQQLTLEIAGLEVGYFGVLHSQGFYLPNTPASARFKRADLVAKDILISSAGAADTQRLGYAAAWNLSLLHTQAQAAGHQLAMRGLRLSTERRLIQLDSVRIQPFGPSKPQTARIALALQRLRLTGFDALALQRERRVRADSLLVERPQLTFALPAAAAPTRSNSVKTYFQQLDLAHLAVREGYLCVAGIAAAPVIRDIRVTASALHFDSAAGPRPGRIFFAKAWDVAVGPSQATVAAHAVSLASLRLATAAGAFDLHSVRVRPPAPGRGQPGGVRVDLTLPGLALTGLDATALQQRHFKARSLVLAGPKLNFTPPSQAPPPVWKLLSKFLRRADLAQLRVQQADVQVGGLRHSPEVYGLNLTGYAIRIDSVAALAPGRVAYARRWQGQSGRLTAPFDPPYYRASSQRTRFDTDAKTFRLDGLALTPKYSAVGMNLHKGYQAPAVSIKVMSLVLSGLDYATLARKGEFRVARVTVQSPVVRIASDGRGPINPHWSKVSPEEMRNLPLIVDVRRLDINNGNLYSTYRSPLTPIPGTMSINRFTGSFLNLSNDPRRQTAATPLTGRATTYLQNRCRLDARVSMYLLDPRGRHRVWGAFGAGPFAMLNAMTVPTRLVKFKSGEVKRLRFDMRMDCQGVTGTAWTEYSGLQMTLLSYKEEEVKKTLLSRLKSKAMNTVVIRDQNPRKRGALVTGETKSTREPRFSVFTLWRQGIVSGLFQNVGVPQPLAQKLSESKDEAPLPR